MLTISTGLYSLYMVFANAMLAVGQLGRILTILGILAPSSLVGAWLLTLWLGPVGAALAAVVATAVAAWITAANVVRRFSVRLDWIALARIAGASFSMYLLALCQRDLGIPLLLLCLELGLLYVALLFVWRVTSWRALRCWLSALQARRAA